MFAFSLRLRLVCSGFQLFRNATRIPCYLFACFQTFHFLVNPVLGSIKEICDASLDDADSSGFPMSCLRAILIEFKACRLRGRGWNKNVLIKIVPYLMKTVAHKNMINREINISFHVLWIIHVLECVHCRICEQTSGGWCV